MSGYIYSDVEMMETSPGHCQQYCKTCDSWVPNTANHEMRREGYFSHSHSCRKNKATGEIEGRESGGAWSAGLVAGRTEGQQMLCRNCKYAATNGCDGIKAVTGKCNLWGYLRPREKPLGIRLDYETVNPKCLHYKNTGRWIDNSSNPRLGRRG
jgi:hypothetical protein